MNLTELELLHAKVLKMTCYEFEMWLGEYCEKKYSDGYDAGGLDGNREGYDKGYKEGYEDGVWNQ